MTTTIHHHSHGVSEIVIDLDRPDVGGDLVTHLNNEGFGFAATFGPGARIRVFCATDIVCRVRDELSMHAVNLITG